MKKLLHKCFALLLLLCIMPAGGCDSAKDLTLGDIAYNANRKFGYTVYIEEDTDLVPYLVLTNNYNDSCLLLRKYLLDKPMRYNPNGRYADGMIGIGGVGDIGGDSKNGIRPAFCLPVDTAIYESEIDVFLIGDGCENSG